MNDKDIHIGDVLRVRQWEDMVNEYGTICDEDSYCYAIKVNKSVKFLKKMKHLCGQIFTVSKYYDLDFNDNNRFYLSKEKVEKENTRAFGAWLICAEMLEPFAEDDFEVANDEDMKLLFG